MKRTRTVLRQRIAVPSEVMDGLRWHVHTRDSDRSAAHAPRSGDSPLASAAFASAGASFARDRYPQVPLTHSMPGPHVVPQQASPRSPHAIQNEAMMLCTQVWVESAHVVAHPLPGCPVGLAEPVRQY
jgi:hypothetical protein